MNLEVYDKNKINQFRLNLEEKLKGNTKTISLSTIPQDFKSRLVRFISFLVVRFISIISVVFIRNTPSVSLDEI
jgi:hypothetical protein